MTNVAFLLTRPFSRPDSRSAAGSARGPACRCGHAQTAHVHYRRGSDCGTCGSCRSYRAG